MTPGHIAKIRMCSNMLEPPAPEVVLQLCDAYDNLKDMPISEEWADKWCADALPVIDAQIEKRAAIAKALGEDR